jgi:hypothetical protein
VLFSGGTDIPRKMASSAIEGGAELQLVSEA